MEPKFKVGQKVVVVDVEGSHVRGISNGDVLTVEDTWEEYDGIFGYEFKESIYTLLERRLEAYTSIAEEIAPVLWQSYCNVLNEEALAALRQVIEDVENHGMMLFEDLPTVGASFDWSMTNQGEAFWYHVSAGDYNKEADKDDCVPVTKPVKNEEEDIGSAATSKPVKSDGGSSDYYKISVKTSHGMANVEVNDVIYAMVGGDFDLANVLKACRRMYLASKGCGKEGVDIAYDVNKCRWFLDDFQMRFGKEE